ncbi:unnamed protein product [Amoebophrya sp. A120]|nr:unnamed protein product [Amoebophrya sp. A120]|eukprot:GSA120T00009421001.1
MLLVPSRTSHGSPFRVVLGARAAVLYYFSSTTQHQLAQAVSSALRANTRVRRDKRSGQKAKKAEKEKKKRKQASQTSTGAAEESNISPSSSSFSQAGTATEVSNPRSVPACCTYSNDNTDARVARPDPFGRVEAVPPMLRSSDSNASSTLGGGAADGAALEPVRPGFVRLDPEGGAGSGTSGGLPSTGLTQNGMTFSTRATTTATRVLRDQVHRFDAFRDQRLSPLSPKFHPAGESKVVTSDTNPKVFDLVPNQLRVSFLSPELLRVQYDNSKDGSSFHDWKTHAIVNRDFSDFFEEDVDSQNWKLTVVERPGGENAVVGVAVVGGAAAATGLWKLESKKVRFHYDASLFKDGDWTSGLIAFERLDRDVSDPKIDLDRPFDGSLFGTTKSAENFPMEGGKRYAHRMFLDCQREKDILTREGREDVFGCGQGNGPGCEPIRSMHCVYGVLNRRHGIALLDDSEMPIYNDAQNWNQHASPPGDNFSSVLLNEYAPNQFSSLPGNKDLYFFAFGKGKQLIDSQTGTRNALYKSTYEKSLAAFRHLTGPQPLGPRYTFGYWLSYWKWCTMRDYKVKGGVTRRDPHKIPFNVEAFDNVLENMFNTLGIPIDVYVLDMQWIAIDWSITSQRDKGGRDVGMTTTPSWGAFKYDRQMGDLPAWHRKWTDNDLGGLQISYNIHPHVGVMAAGIEPKAQWHEEAAYLQITSKICPDRQDKGGCMWGEYAENAEMLNLMDDVAMPIKNHFVAWWDFQAGDYEAVNQYPEKCRKQVDRLGNSKQTVYPCGEYGTKNWHPLQAINRVTYDGAIRRQEFRRGLQMSRFSGYGSHRYPMGFAGDQAKTWEALSWAPYWTVTASNAGYGYWSHDLICCDWGDPDRYQSWEKYMRWLQFGALTPNMRTHDKGAGDLQGVDMGAHMLFWDYPAVLLQASKQLVLWRSMLIPYLYHAAYLCSYTGISLMRPLYYNWPELEEAYGPEMVREEWESRNPFAYMLGDALLVNPITKSSGANVGDDWDIDRSLGYSHVRIRKSQYWNNVIDLWPTWLPPLPDGVAWYDLTNGAFLEKTLTNEEGYRILNQNIFTIDDFPLYQRSDMLIPLQIRQFTIGGATREKYMKELIFQAIAPSYSQAAMLEEDDSTSSTSGDLALEQRGTVLDDAYGMNPNYADEQFLEISCVLRWVSRLELRVYLMENYAGKIEDDLQTKSGLVPFDQRKFSLFLHNFAGTISSAEVVTSGGTTTTAIALQSSYSRPRDTDTTTSADVGNDVQKYGLRTITACVLSCTRITGLPLMRSDGDYVKIQLQETIPSSLIQGLRGADRKIGRAEGKREFLDEDSVEWSETDIAAFWSTVNAGRLMNTDGLDDGQKKRLSNLYDSAQQMRNL